MLFEWKMNPFSLRGCRLRSTFSSWDDPESPASRAKSWFSADPASSFQLSKCPASHSPQNNRRFQFGSEVGLFPRVTRYSVEKWKPVPLPLIEASKVPWESEILPSNLFCPQENTREHPHPNSQLVGHWSIYQFPVIRTIDFRAGNFSNKSFSF